MVRKFSELTLDSTPGAGSYVPYVDPTEASTADQNKRLLVSDLEGADGADGSSALPVGYLDATAYGVDPAKYALWNGINGDSSMTPADSTADFQAVFDAAAVLHGGTPTRGGVTILFPRGRYLMTGTVTIPDMAGVGSFLVDMTNVEIIHKPQTTGVTMFKTALPTDNNDAEAKNDVRDMWTWRGGFYDGDIVDGQIGFEWNCVSRMVMERVRIQSFDEGIVGRFVLHFRLQNSRVESCKDYGVRIEEDGDWTGGTEGNAASNVSIFENVRFFGRSSNLAQLRVAHSGHTVRDCTFEGESPNGNNYQFVNFNNSVLTSRLENCWFENDAVQGHCLIDTPHEFYLDFQYSNSSSVVADVKKCSLLTVGRAPWPDMVNNTNPRWKVNSGDPANVNIRFDGAGQGGKIDPSRPQLWVDGIMPKKIYATTFTDSESPIIFATAPSTNPRGQIWSFEPPSVNATALSLGATEASEWTLKFKPIDAANTVLPAITGTATVGNTLTVSDGTWDGAPPPTFTYQWTRDTVDIAGATESTYLLVGADSGTTVGCDVTGTNDGASIGATELVSATGVAVT